MMAWADAGDGTAGKRRCAAQQDGAYKVPPPGGKIIIWRAQLALRALD
jgi:hypothetical protein